MLPSTRVEPGAAAAPPTGARAAVVDPGYAARLLAWLERYKEYPRAARLRGIEGRLTLRLTVGTAGNVLAASVASSSGSPLLDQAAIDTVRRAEPLPALPAGTPGGRTELLVPIVFELR